MFWPNPQKSNLSNPLKLQQLMVPALALLLILNFHPLSAHSDYPLCSDTSTYHFYNGNTSYKGLSNTQGYHDNNDSSLCDLSAENCGDCDFVKLKPLEWYRFLEPFTKVVEVTEVAEECPERGHCNGRRQLVLKKSKIDTRHKGSWYFRVVMSNGGKCHLLGQDIESDLVEKNDCDDFFLYRFPKLFAKHSCGGDGSTWNPTSMCLDDSKPLSPFWVYIMVTISVALLILITTFAVYSVYNHHVQKRRRSVHMYHQATEANRQSTHSYADLATIGFQVTMPPPSNRPDSSDTAPIVPSENQVDGGEAEGAVVFLNGLVSDSHENATVDSDPLGRVSAAGSTDSALLQDSESNNQLPLPVTDNPPSYLVPSLHRTKLHSYINTPHHNSRIAPSSSPSYMTPDELRSGNSQNVALHFVNPQTSAVSSSSNYSNLDPIAFAALFSHSESPSVISSPSDRSSTPEASLEREQCSRLGVADPGDSLDRGESCCLDSCTDCPEAETQRDSKNEDPLTKKMTDNLSDSDVDPLSVTFNKSIRVVNFRKCCNCRCSERQTDRFFRIQSV